MRFRWELLAICLGLSALPVLPRNASADDTVGSQVASRIASAPGEKREDFSKDIAPLLARYCNKCHAGARAKAKLALDQYKDEAAALNDRGIWEKIAQRLRDREMPPPDKPQPTPSEAKLILDWIDAKLVKIDCTGKIDPGRVTLRRLNRAEYNNTIRDLVGVDFKPAEDFPADDVGYGFDNIGDVLSLPPLLLEKYLAAAEKITSRAWALPHLRQRIMIAQPSGKNEEECARKILENFGRRAYRRPVTPDEINRLVALVKLARSQGDNFDKGIQLAVQAILTSPHFLFRVERDPKPASTEPRLISEYDLATRLSYFLWASMPDDELLKQAQQGTLRKNLEAQLKRMLKDQKSKAFGDNFASQWLQTRNLQKAAPNPMQFPHFDESLRGAMQRETERFFEAVLREDRSILEFIDSDFTFLNEQLARHYGIPGVKGNYFRRVSLTDHNRGGVLTQASILTITSNPTRTSPVKRGKWIMENILGTPPPPPVPDAGPLDETKEAALSGSLRQRMEQHRANPNCASCHQRMDPLGFGFENYDAVGVWRDRDGSFAIDASGVLPDGKAFQGPPELKKILIGKKDEFCRCLTERILTYAVGRGMESEDKCVIDRIARTVAEDNYRLSRIVFEVVKSEPFQMRSTRAIGHAQTPADNPKK